MGINGIDNLLEGAEQRDILEEILKTARNLGDQVRIAEDEENEPARADARALWVEFRNTLTLEGEVRRSAVDAYYDGYTES